MQATGGEARGLLWTALINGDTEWDNVYGPKRKRVRKRTGRLDVNCSRMVFHLLESALSVSEANEGGSSSGGVMRATCFLLIIQ